MTGEFTQKVIPSPDALFQEVAGEIVILDLKSESYFGLNEVGARIWQLMQAHGELQQVYDAMLEEFEVDSQQLQSDIQELVKELAEAGLVAVDGQEAA